MQRLGLTVHILIGNSNKQSVLCKLLHETKRIMYITPINKAYYVNYFNKVNSALTLGSDKVRETLPDNCVWYGAWYDAKQYIIR